MPIKFESINNGDVLYDCHKYRMGNTTRTAWGTWRVIVIEKGDHGAMASWNANAPRFFSRRSLEKLRRTPRKQRSTDAR